MRRCFQTGLIWLLTALASWAQDTAQVNGTLSDTSGALIPAATVTIKNPDTGFTRTTQSTKTGSYVLQFIPPGRYELRVEARGFSSVLQRGIPLRVGEVLTLNYAMKPGGTNEVVEVTEQAPLIETSRSEIGGSVTPTEVRELPIVDRNFSGLMALVPGVRPSQGFDPTKTRSGNVSVNGNDGRAFNYNVDGADNKDAVIGGLVQNFTMEGIQEFKVQTDHYSAESGRSVGGVVDVVTKSGTNTLHGSAFGLFQNSGLNKNDFFSLQTCAAEGIPSDNCPKPKFHRYHFGGSIGGPIKKDKLFFFGAYENKREPGSIAGRSDAVQQLALFPLAQPVTQLPFPYIDHLLTVKIDYQISSAQNMFFRYGRERWTNPNDQLGNPFTADLSQTNSDTNQFHDFVIQHNYTVSPTKLNSLNLHYQYFKNAILPDPARTFTLPVAGGGTVTNPEICFKPAPGCGGGDPEIGQNVNVPQETLISKYQVRDDFSWVRGSHTFKFGANWVHLPKLGGFFFFGANGYQITFWDDPSVIVSNTAAYPQGFATPGAIQELAFSGGSGSTDQTPRPDEVGLYFQDDWKVTPHLTLNLGLRWDVNYRFLPRMLGDSALNTNRTIAILQQVAASNPSAIGAEPGVARAIAFTGDTDRLKQTTASFKEFQPRIGFAWDPTGAGTIVIRGGYGIARDQVFQNLTLFALQQARPTIYQTIIDLLSTSGPTSAGGCVGQLCNFRFGVDPLPAPAPGVTEIATGATGRINDPHMNDPWAQQSSIGVAWQIRPTMSVSADYYHVLGTHEPRVLNINPVISSVCDPSFPGANPTDPRCVAGVNTRFFDAAFVNAGLGAGRLGQIYDYATNSRSQFDSLNIQVQKRIRRFTGQASYVLSRSQSWGGLPSASYRGSNATAITPEVEFLPNEFGRTPMDERHRFVLSGVAQLPWGFEVAPLVQVASARPFEFRAGTDLNGDGRSNLDRVCLGSTIANPILTPGCSEVNVNTLHGKPLMQVDLRTAKAFKLSDRATLRLYWEFYNLFNRQNFCGDFQQNVQAADFGRPLGYCGFPVGGFGPTPTGPFKSQYGLRFDF